MREQRSSLIFIIIIDDVLIVVPVAICFIIISISHHAGSSFICWLCDSDFYSFVIIAPYLYNSICFTYFYILYNAVVPKGYSLSSRFSLMFCSSRRS